MKKLIAALFCVACLSAAEPYSLFIDRFMSPNAGGQTLLSIHDGLRKGEESLIKTGQDLPSDKWMRSAELGLFYLPVSYLTMVVQHEVFGHGFRLRSFGKDISKVEGYEFGSPPPFGSGGGGTGFSTTDKYAPAHYASGVIGGVEATGILAHSIRMRWLTNNAIGAKDNLLQIFSHHDLFEYAFTLFFANDQKEAGGHDLINYTQILRRTYPKTKIRGRHLAALSFISFANPFDIMGWGAMHTYATKGKNETPLSMLKLGSVHMLPAMKMGLAPYGPEIFLQNFMRIKDKPIYTYLKGGFLGNHHYYGLGLEHPQLLTNGRHSFGVKGDFWHHPRLLTKPGAVRGEALHETPNVPLGYEEAYLSEKQLGISASATYNYTLGEKGHGIQLELGRKMAGFMPGEVLGSAPIIRGCFRIKI